MGANKGEIKIREKEGKLLLPVRVQPGAASNQIVGAYDGALKIRLTASPQRNRANRQLLDFLAHTLNVPAQNLSLHRGRSSRSKMVEIQGLSEQELIRLIRSLSE
jgi:uncharacterized protein (TIGR00251 family)